MIKTIFLPIKPEYCDKIISGKKKWEFRRSIPREAINNIVLYSSSPTQKILGIAKVEKIVCDSPDKVWKIAKKDSGISEEFFNKYFSGCDRAYAIRLGEIRKTIPFSPSEVGVSVPQSFCYITAEQFLEIQDRIPLRVFISGIHGSGKSSICQKIESENSEFRHITCSKLIKYSGARTRVDAVDKNQEDLIYELNNLQMDKKVWMIDGHLALLSDNAISTISNNQISRMNLDLIVLKLIDPNISSSRLLSRDALEIESNQLQDLQNAEISSAFLIASELGIPIYISNSDEDIARRIISACGTRSIHVVDDSLKLI